MKKHKALGPKWWTQSPDPNRPGFFAIPYFLATDPTWTSLSPTAIKLYIAMRASVLNPADPRANWYPEKIRFGHSRVKAIMSKDAYSRALKSLIEVGLLEVLEDGRHGREGLYDITATRWSSIMQYTDIIYEG